MHIDVLCGFTFTFPTSATNSDPRGGIAKFCERLSSSSGKTAYVLRTCFFQDATGRPRRIPAGRGPLSLRVKSALLMNVARSFFFQRTMHPMCIGGGKMPICIQRYSVDIAQLRFLQTSLAVSSGSCIGEFMECCLPKM